MRGSNSLMHRAAAATGTNSPAETSDYAPRLFSTGIANHVNTENPQQLRVKAVKASAPPARVVGCQPPPRQPKPHLRASEHPITSPKYSIKYCTHLLSLTNPPVQSYIAFTYSSLKKRSKQNPHHTPGTKPIRLHNQDAISNPPTALHQRDIASLVSTP